MESIDQMSIIVTGGGSGIGAETARLFVEQGARVTICGRREDKLREVASALGEPCQAVPADITAADDRERLVERSVEHGGDRLDVVVHAAANMYAGPIDTLEETQLLDLFHANVVGPMMLTGLCVPQLERTRGTVILFGSVHTSRAFPGASPYAATKGAVETLTRVLAAELGSRDIRVSCIRPGAVLTELNQRAGLFDDETARERLEGLAPAHALGRIGTPREVAEGVAYLAAAQWTTGDVLVVDGGLGLGVTHA